MTGSSQLRSLTCRVYYIPRHSEYLPTTIGKHPKQLASGLNENVGLTGPAWLVGRLPTGQTTSFRRGHKSTASSDCLRRSFLLKNMTGHPNRPFGQCPVHCLLSPFVRRSLLLAHSIHPPNHPPLTSMTQDRSESGQLGNHDTDTTHGGSPVVA